MLKAAAPINLCTPSKCRPGFTLVEMLVVVALVLIMMVMFTQIFVMATGSLSQQRGIAENDQRGRLLSATLRGDLNRRTFRDVLPFRANEDTRQLGNSLARRAGYFEIDEGDPTSNIDDVLQFTASVNIQLQSKDGSPFIGNAVPLSLLTSVPVSGTSLTLTNTSTLDYSSYIGAGAVIWVQGSPSLPYVVSSVTSTGLSGTTTVTVATTIAVATGTTAVNIYFSENDPDFDDGVFGNQIASSALAEVCYYLRNGNLYRRVLLIRDASAGRTAQPAASTGISLFWNGTNEKYGTNGTTTFWRDFDYSAFYFPGTNTVSGSEAPGVRFHDSRESMSNSSQSPLMVLNDQTSPITTFPMSLGIPHLRFGHSVASGLPQDASTTATLTTGATVTIGRFNVQECSSAAFGYPGYLPNDPVSGAANTNPFDRQNIQINSSTGLVAEYTSTIPSVRRGEDILMSNVLTFDIKVWDPINLAFVDIGSSSPTGPFSSNVGVIYDAAGGNIVAGKLNSAYCAVGSGQYRFDTWHPNAYVVSSTLYSAEPYTSTGGVSPSYFYTEPPYIPYVYNPITGLNQAAPLSAIQITINFRDVSSNQIRQMTLIQSLIDRSKLPSTTNEAPEE